ncbi:MAG: helix-turn-helix domain-containing protein [Parasporobacterium sp.]|nr:helix-turn-helix domain-containing protein [Parasporobacterium sp.]
MELSMWILADALAAHHPEVHINDGSRVLKSARITSDQSSNSSTAVFLSQDINGRVICAHSTDMLVFKDKDIFEILNDILAVFDRFNEWEAETARMTEEGCSTSELVTKFGQILDMTLFLADTTFYSYAQHYQSEEDKHSQPFLTSVLYKLPPMELALAINNLPDIRTPKKEAYYVNVPDSGDALALTAARNLFLNDRHIGWIVAIKKTALTEGEMQLLDVTGQLTEAYHRVNSRDTSDLERTSLFIDILEEKQVKEEDIDRRLMPFNWLKDHWKLAYNIGNETMNNYKFGSHPETEILNKNTFRFSHGGSTILLVDLAISPEEDIDKAMAFLIKETGVNVGKSRPFQNMFQLKEQVETAEIARKYADADRQNPASFKDAAVPYGCALIKEGAAVSMSHPALKLLKDYDEKHHAELYSTLQVFLDNERSFSKTTELLHIHRSTLIYRIQRITDLTGIDPENTEERLWLQISYRM